MRSQTLAAASANDVTKGDSGGKTIFRIMFNMSKHNEEFKKPKVTTSDQNLGR